MALEHAQSLAMVTLAFSNGEVVGVTAQRNHYITDNGKPVPGSGRYEDVPVPLNDPSLVALLGDVNLALVAAKASAEAALAEKESEVDTLVAAKKAADAAAAEAVAAKEAAEAEVAALKASYVE